MEKVVETPPYLADADAALSEDERVYVADAFCSEPELGELIAGTGGVRLAKFQEAGDSENGFSVLSFFAGDLTPVFLLAFIRKEERYEMSLAERQALAARVNRLTSAYLAKAPRRLSLVRCS